MGLFGLCGLYQRYGQRGFPPQYECASILPRFADTTAKPEPERHRLTPLPKFRSQIGSAACRFELIAAPHGGGKSKRALPPAPFGKPKCAHDSQMSAIIRHKDQQNENRPPRPIMAAAFKKLAVRISIRATWPVFRWV